MAEIFRVNESDVAWMEYRPSAADDGGPVPIRVKPLTLGAEGVPGVQYVDYGPGHTDPIHSHDTGEFFVVVEGEFWLEGIRSGPGSVVFIPRDYEYAVQAGEQGCRYYRVVVG